MMQSITHTKYQSKNLLTIPHKTERKTKEIIKWDLVTKIWGSKKLPSVPSVQITRRCNTLILTFAYVNGPKCQEKESVSNWGLVAPKQHERRFLQTCHFHELVSELTLFKYEK